MIDFTEILFEVKDDIHFYNITYRGYIGIWNGYVFDVKPFALSVHKLTEEHLEKFKNDKYNMAFGNIIDCVGNYHHQEYVRRECKKDPCDLYEFVSGDNIHNGGCDAHKLNRPKEYYEKAKIEFIANSRKFIRNDKINTLCRI